MSRNRMWTVGTVLLVIAIVAAGWFLAIAPKRATAADLRSQQAAATQQADGLRTQIAMLKAQAADLPAQRARLATFQTKFPQTVELPRLIRGLTGANSAAGATLVTITPGLPAAPGADASAGTGTPPPANSPYLLVPVSVVVEGTYAQLVQFLDAVEALPRAVLATDVSIAGASDNTGTTSSASPLLQATVSIKAFVSPAGAAVSSTVPGAVPSTGSPS